ncbi:MAG: DUF4276 family protein [Planctomycetes bacterium]|nr:DUF4276 family protein [Planctomycetota bacterium]
MKVRVYVEGGGDGKTLKIRCREGFRKLLEKAGFVERMPAIIACGGRASAFDDFKTAISDSAEDPYPILLVDSESAVHKEPWDHLKERDNWDKPDNADDDHAHLMVQCMETWIVADQDAVKEFFGQKLLARALPPTNDLESRSKDDVQSKLRHATKDCGEDRRYEKGKRSFELLGRLDPTKLETLPHFSRSRKALESKL